MNGAVQPDGDGLFGFGKNSHGREYPGDQVPKDEEVVHPVSFINLEVSFISLPTLPSFTSPLHPNLLSSKSETPTSV